MDDQRIILIKPKKHKLLLLYAMLFLGFPIITYYIYSQKDWLRLGFYGLVWVVIIADVIRQLTYQIRKKNVYEKLTLKLTPQGFCLGDILYKWSDIEYIGTKKEYISLFSLFSKDRVVCWNYKPNYKKKTLHFLSAYDETLSAEYEMEPDKIAELLNDWKSRYSKS